MKTDNRVSVRVWGDFACFTRPEMKVRRVSKPWKTPRPFGSIAVKSRAKLNYFLRCE